MCLLNVIKLLEIPTVAQPERFCCSVYIEVHRMRLTEVQLWGIPLLSLPYTKPLICCVSSIIYDTDMCFCFMLSYFVMFLFISFEAT